MTVLNSEILGPFYGIIPIVAFIYLCLIAPIYFYKFQSNKTMALAFPIWYVIGFFGLSYPDPFIQNLSFSPNMMNDLVGVLWYNVAFMVPATILFLAWSKTSWFRNLFIEKIPYYIMIAFQSYRICGLGYIYLWYTDTVGNFCIGWVGFCDLTISLTSIPLALHVKKYGLKESSHLVFPWTVLGVSDVGLGFVLYYLNYLQVYSKDENSLAVFMLYPISGILFTFVEWIYFTHFIYLFNADALMNTRINAPGGDPSAYTAIP